MLKRAALFVCDLAVIGLAAVLAFVLRENLAVSQDELKAFLPYAGTSMLIGSALLLVFRTHRGVWRMSALGEYMRLCLASALIVALSMSVGFLGYRLQNIPRALPVLQLLLTMTGLVGLRVAARLLVDWSRARRSRSDGALARGAFPPGTRTVILYGLNRMTMLYVRSTEDLAPTQVRIAGIVTAKSGAKGRAFGRYPVLGSPREIARIVADLTVHGVFVTHLVVMKPREDLDPEDHDSLFVAAGAHGLVIEFFVDQIMGAVQDGEHAPESQRRALVPRAPYAHGNVQTWQCA